MEDKIMSKTKQFKNSKKCIVLLLALVMFCNVLYAQTEFPGGEYWSFDTGAGMTDILVKGLSYEFVVDPKIWLSPSFMVGNRFGANYSTDQILSFETLAYLRWNFLRSANPKKQVNAFIQGGIGMLAAYRGEDTPFGDISNNRGSAMFDAAAGVTIPLGSRWHIEPSIRTGYPHIVGFSLTAGCKFPLQPRARKVPSSNEIIRRIQIASFDSIMFGPDTEQYNVDINQATRDLNEKILDSTVKTLKENPNFRVRIEGHANPVTKKSSEAERLMTLSRMRADTIAWKLREKGVTDEQMVITAFGGARTLSNDAWNINRRVELIVVQVNTDL
jgi:outer membrane protein OmpA-like peptidoglycan-associated protein